MTELLKKYGFEWNDDATKSFSELKKAMLTTPVLAYPNFTEVFILETDASQLGIEAVLMQQGHLIAYYNKKLIGRRKASSTYVRELFAITQAVAK